ncbi:GNAT family N-acetyltransferase [Bacteroides pyogenes]|nr:GNAT family N-acetyltransferase [Bacteroides pyogenes]
MAKVATEKLVEFFAKQPDDAYTFFKPHGFDAKSIKKNQKNKSFLAYVLFENNEVVAYCFIRSFFHGKGFRGRMVDIDHRGKGLGTLMNKVMNEIGFGMGLRLYETVSKDNVASYRSAISASNVKIVEEMENNELYLEILPE